MKKYVNGEYIEMTAEEVAVWEHQQEEVPTESATRDERIEAQVMYTAMMTDTILPSEQ